ncbi:pentapeptide repeat-containing protein [Streptosporangium amethystogenes]|uniref:pentapeptide repeat-containing protein n=1 Tax=Streptosporangium amethystogenes TaxID=2002 RepID=UPI003CCBF6B7
MISKVSGTDDLPAQPSPAQLSSAQLSSAQLSSAQLSSAQLSSAQLSSAQPSPAQPSPNRAGGRVVVDFRPSRGEPWKPVCSAPRTRRISSPGLASAGRPEPDR